MNNRQRTGSDGTWISLRPRGWEAVRDRSPAEQVAWQVLSIEESIERQLLPLPQENVLELTYEDLTERPRDVAELVRGSLTTQGYATRLRREMPNRFKASASQGPSEGRTEVEAAIKRLQERGS